MAAVAVASVEAVEMVPVVVTVAVTEAVVVTVAVAATDLPVSRRPNDQSFSRSN